MVIHDESRVTPMPNDSVKPPEFRAELRKVGCWSLLSLLRLAPGYSMPAAAPAPAPEACEACTVPDSEEARAGPHRVS